MSEKAPKDQEQKIAEGEVEAFKQELGPFVIAAETTRMAMLFTDAREADNPIIFANDSFLKLTGYERDEVLAQSFSFILASSDDEDAMREIASAFANPSQEEPEICFRRKDMSQGWASMFVNPVKDEQGVVIQHFVSLVDMTRYRTAQQNAAMLIDELNHRVKNTLTTVQSIVTQAVRNSTDPLVIRKSIETRIAALSRSHDLLGREKWDGAGLDDLVREALEPFRVTHGNTERFSIEGENIRLSPKAALALGIAFHELATNAVKYGAFSNEAGSVSIKWTVAAKPDGQWLCLHWRESGGPPVTVPNRKGFGSRIIEQGLAHELKGKITLAFPPGGVVCTIDIPKPQAVING